MFYQSWGFYRILAWGKIITKSFLLYSLYFYSKYIMYHNLDNDVQDVKLLIEDIGELKPTIFCAVPRVLDRIYSGTSHDASDSVSC